MTTFNGQAAEHPSLTDAKRRLEMLERRTPPGYPLGYSLHVHTTACTGCGSVAKASQLWTINRAGASGKSYHPSNGKERMYDLPVEFVRRDQITPRCEACIGLLAREAVPALPAYGERLRPRLHNLADEKVKKIDQSLLDEIDLEDIL